MYANSFPDADCNDTIKYASRRRTLVLEAMSPLEQFDAAMDAVIRELTLRILLPRLSEFEYVWDAANRICDRYEIKREPTDLDEVSGRLQFEHSPCTWLSGKP
jgi:hypothetical protein